MFHITRSHAESLTFRQHFRAPRQTYSKIQFNSLFANDEREKEKKKFTVTQKTKPANYNKQCNNLF